MPRPNAVGVCATPGCPEHTEPGKRMCRAHRIEAWKGSHSHGFPSDIKRERLHLFPRCECPGCWLHDDEERCPRASREVDHVVPVARGGTNTWENARALCPLCHDAKTKREAREGQGRRR